MMLRYPDPPLRDPATEISLRPWGARGDANALATAWADPAIAANSVLPQDRTEDAARRWIAGEAARRQRGLALDLVIEGPQPGAVVGARVDDAPRVLLGEVGLARFDPSGRAEIGFWLTAMARGRGIASTAVDLLSAWALNDAGLNRKRLWARVRPENARAGRVLQRSGYARIGDASGYVIWARDCADIVSL
jgi:[ribosomal protein S5]-alanine N-acetyltransferase